MGGMQGSVPCNTTRPHPPPRLFFANRCTLSIHWRQPEIGEARATARTRGESLPTLAGASKANRRAAHRTARASTVTVTSTDASASTIHKLLYTLSPMSENTDAAPPRPRKGTTIVGHRGLCAHLVSATSSPIRYMYYIQAPLLPLSPCTYTEAVSPRYGRGRPREGMFTRPHDIHLLNGAAGTLAISQLPGRTKLCHSRMAPARGVASGARHDSRFAI
mmetsp:Transcript_30036/g.80339  ORF Transcript_30036/g.80339 Transcript_30036/m.80339 type:complete len:219 (-) Transcript_30036:174-830(-)